MPSSITHELIAHAALELLPAGTREAALRAPDCFYLGAQGPDLFFFYRPLAHEGNFGKHLHRRQVYEWFTALLSLLGDYAGADFDKCLAYALGFCTHLTADVIFHPFVYNYLKKHGAKKNTHQRIENDWDVYFLRQLRGKSVHKYPYPFDLAAIAEDGTLLRYITACAEILGREIRPAAFRRMLRHYNFYLKHFHREHNRVLSAFGLSAHYPKDEPLAGVIDGEDFPALSEGMGGSADELFLLAAKESATCMATFLEAFNEDAALPPSIFSRHLLTGKEI